MAIKLGGGGGSASQVNEIVYLNESANTITLDDERVYLKGGVFETDPTEYPDAVFEWKALGPKIFYNGQGSQGRGMEYDGAWLWQVNNASNYLFKYNLSTLSYASFGFSLNNQCSDAGGVAWDGNYFWVVCTNQNHAFKYNASGTYQNTNFSTYSQDADPHDIVWDGTHFWVLGNATKKVYKYNASGSYQNVNFSVGSEISDPRGLAWDGTYFYVTGYVSPTAKMYKYNSSGVFQSAIALPNPTSYATTYEGLVSIGSDIWASPSGDPYSIFKLTEASGVTADSQFGGNNYLRVK
jgi:hypothetical protein